MMSMNTNLSLEGVKIIALKKISDERGTIMHGARVDGAYNKLLSNFGEVYFKKLYPNIINGWHVHQTLILNYICVLGMIKLVLYDLRKKSPTYRKFQEIYFGDDNYCLIHIPAGIATAAKSVTFPYSIFCNIASEPHNPAIKYLRIDPHLKKIPYDWNKKDY